jgi:hypothetical protein
MDPTTLAIGTGLVGLGLFVWFFCAYLAYQAAPQRGRTARNWLILGIFFGPFALFALYLMAPKPGAHRAGSKAHKDQRADLYEVPKKK